MVMDVERYPEFLPWCKAARILEKHDDFILAELVISFKGMRESYVSKVMPLTDGAASEIHVSLVRGPFRHLTNQWRFLPCDEGAQIEFSLDFEMKYHWMEMILGSLFSKAVEKMVHAFSARAENLYK